MVNGSFLIGNVKITIDGDERLPHPENLELFRITEDLDNNADDDANSNVNNNTNGSANDNGCVCHYKIQVVDDLLAITEHLKEMRIGSIVTREDLTVFQTSTGECRLMNFKGADWQYAASLQRAPNQCEIWFLRQVEPQLFLDTVFWAPFCLERLLMERGGIVLHSAYMERNGQAVLFSAPSGTGKSTQANLWTRYRNTRTINGDRTLLKKRENRWFAYGWPICGSSEICVNEAFPVRAIVMLCQAKKNQIRELHGFEAVKKVFAQLMVNNWNRSFQETAMDLLSEILEEIPVFELACDISEQAVECLEECLKKGEK